MSGPTTIRSVEHALRRLQRERVLPATELALAAAHRRGHLDTYTIHAVARIEGRPIESMTDDELLDAAERAAGCYLAPGRARHDITELVDVLSVAGAWVPVMRPGELLGAAMARLLDLGAVVDELLEDMRGPA